jgi:hypothetical protein
MSATNWSVGRYFNLMVPCSTWALRKCHFIPMCLVFSLTKAFWEYAMALWLSFHVVVVSVFGWVGIWVSSSMLIKHVDRTAGDKLQGAR